MATGIVAIRQVRSSLISKAGFHLSVPKRIVVAWSGDVVWQVATLETWKAAADIFNTDSGARNLALQLYGNCVKQSGAVS